MKKKKRKKKSAISKIKLKVPKLVKQMIVTPSKKWTPRMQGMYKLLELHSNLIKEYESNSKLLDTIYTRGLKEHNLKNIKMVQAGIKELSSLKGRVTHKSLKTFMDLYDWTTKPGAIVSEAVVNDRKSNFKRLLLEKLAEQGINIYSPTELNKILKGYSIDTIVENATLMDTLDEDNYYDAIDEDAVAAIDSIIEELREDENNFKSLRSKSDVVENYEFF